MTEEKKDEPASIVETLPVTTEDMYAALKKDNEALLSAVRELTKIVGERMKGMEEEWGKWRKAGKF